ncbi:MAG: hypothetical protein ACT6RZ_01135 [Methylophilus sp.]|uniref:hypothetical protein n=1 Tax=Methylophilus sp. TaxID=29541 RepID=UPI00403546C2
MHPFIKKLFAFIALLSLLSSSAWAVSPQVLVDDVFAPENTAMLDVHLQQGTDDSRPPHQESTCNHACHFSAHLLGLISGDITPAIPRLDSGSYTSIACNNVSYPFLKGLYRPPILL